MTNDGKPPRGSAAIRRVPVKGATPDKDSIEVTGDLLPGMVFVTNGFGPIDYVPGNHEKSNEWDLDGTRVMVVEDAGPPR